MDSRPTNVFCSPPPKPWSNLKHHLRPVSGPLHLSLPSVLWASEDADRNKNDLFFRVRIQAVTEMTHTGSRRETLTSDLPSSVHRESRCYSNHITNSERRELLHMASRSMPLIGGGTWMASSPKFLALQVLLVPTAKTHGWNCTAEGMFSICRTSGALVLKDRLRPPKAFWISGVGSGNLPFEGAVPSNSEQGWFWTSITQDWIPTRKSTWRRGQLSLCPTPTPWGHCSLSSWDLGQVSYIFTSLSRIPYLPMLFYLGAFAHTASSTWNAFSPFSANWNSSRSCLPATQPQQTNAQISHPSLTNRVFTESLLYVRHCCYA